jgi:hypothetical protein
MPGNVIFISEELISGCVGDGYMHGTVNSLLRRIRTGYTIPTCVID